jgi:hypothetical protein
LTLVIVCSIYVLSLISGPEMWDAYEVLEQSVEPLKGFAEPPPSARIVPLNETANSIGSTLGALADTPLASRFCSWRGLSGRRYVFSVYSASECPAFRDAVLLAAVSDHNGRRRMVSVRATGSFPEPIVKRTELELRAYGGNLEFHVHLLASSPAKREVALADLAAASP